MCFCIASRGPYSPPEHPEVPHHEASSFSGPGCCLQHDAGKWKEEGMAMGNC